MQIFQDKGATFFNDGTANVIAPGVTTRIAAAGQIVLRKLFVILRQNVCIERLILVFVHNKRRRQARLDIRVIRRPAKAQTKQRQNVLRQLQQFGDRLNIVTQTANEYAAKSQRLCRRQRILRHHCSINHAQQQLFRQPKLRIRANLQMTIKISAKHPELSGLGHMLLAAR